MSFKLKIRGFFKVLDPMKICHFHRYTKNRKNFEITTPVVISPPLRVKNSMTSPIIYHVIKAVNVCNKVFIAYKGQEGAEGCIDYPGKHKAKDLFLVF